jgi:hypothetical protein
VIYPRQADNMYLERGLLAGPGRHTRRFAGSRSYGRTGVFLCCGLLLLIYLVVSYHSGLQQGFDDQGNSDHEPKDEVDPSFYKLKPANSTLGVSATDR